MQTQTSTQPPPVPEPPPAPVSITTVGSDGKPVTLAVPKSPAEVEQLLITRRELSNQLESVSERRSELSEQIRVAPDGVSKSGLEDRLRVLDQRIVQLENDISLTGRQLAAAPAGLVASSEGETVAPGPPSGGDDWAEGMAAGVFSTFFVAFFAYWFLRRRWRRRSVRKTPELPTDSAQRLERLEQGMDAIAVEIERISEGQRFVTRLLSESHGPLGVPNRIAEPAAAAEASPQR